MLSQWQSTFPYYQFHHAKHVLTSLPNVLPASVSSVSVSSFCERSLFEASVGLSAWLIIEQIGSEILILNEDFKKTSWAFTSYTTEHISCKTFVLAFSDNTCLTHFYNSKCNTKLQATHIQKYLVGIFKHSCFITNAITSKSNHIKNVEVFFSLNVNCKYNFSKLISRWKYTIFTLFDPTGNCLKSKENKIFLESKLNIILCFNITLKFKRQS